LLLPARQAWLWIYPEHRDIHGWLALVGAGCGAALYDSTGCGTEARVGHEAPAVRRPRWTHEQGEKPSCFDWAAWPAVAGDHSCSGQALVSTILERA
jgi:hypothetical protein